MDHLQCYHSSCPNSPKFFQSRGSSPPEQAVRDVLRQFHEGDVRQRTAVVEAAQDTLQQIQDSNNP